MKSIFDIQSYTKKTIVINTALVVAIFTITTLIGFLFQRIRFYDTNIVIIYLVAVLIAAWLTKSLLFGILSSFIATFLFSYFFTLPYFAFEVDDPNYIITFITMTITALITSTLTSHANRSAKAAQEKEAETKAIYSLANRLTDAKTIHDIASIATKAVSLCFSCKAACLCYDESGLPEQSFIQQASDEKQIRRNIGDVLEYQHKIDKLRTGVYQGEEFYDWPIYGTEEILGVIRIPKDNAQFMNEPKMRLLRAMIESVALAMDRFRLNEQQMLSREETVKERYRANLLRAISHDLRTPLSGIIGTTEMLMDADGTTELQLSLARDIHNEANWLHSLVENILNLTRLQDGTLSLVRQMEPLEEIIESAISRVEKRTCECDIGVFMPDELVLVPVDAKLIEQVLINLLDNAIAYTKLGEPISIIAEKDSATQYLSVTVQDSGSGISSTDLPHIFQTFFTSRPKHADAGMGIGLGLAICETIVNAHGGSISARNRTNGTGAEFTFTIPLEVKDNESEQL